MKKSRTSRRILTASIATVLTSLLPFVENAHAASGAWNVDAAGNWGTAANWNPAVVPGTAAGDVVDLTRDITAARTVTIDTTSRTVGDLNIGDPTATLFGYTLASSAGTVVLNLDGTGAADATVDFLTGVANTISAPLTLVDNGVIRSNVAFVQTLSGVISGTGKTLTFNNDTNGVANAAAANNGQFLVTGNNTYTGGTTISDVRVTIQTNNTALGAAGSAVTIANGGQFFNSSGLQTMNYAFNIAGNGWVETAGQLGALRLDSGAIVTGTVAMSANAAIGSNSGTGTVNGVVSGAGFTLSKVGVGQITLGGANTYTGGTTIGNGALQLNNNTAAGTGAITLVTGGATNATKLLINGGVTIANPISFGNVFGVAGNGVLQQTGTGLATINGTITITGSPTAGGHFVGGGSAANALVLGGAITSTVGVTQRDGFVVYKGGGTGYTLLTVTNTAQAGATNGIATSANVGLGGSGTGTLDLNGFDQSLAGLIFGQAANANTGIVSLGGRTLTLTADVSSITGAFNAPHAINATAGGTLSVGASARTFTIADSTAPDDLAINTAAISGTGGIVKAGTGTLALNGAAIAGPLTINAGTLQAGRSNAVGSISSQSLAFGAGATTLRMKIGASGDLITTGTLTTGGTTTVALNQAGGIVANNTYPLINYTGTSPGLSGFTLSSVGHATAALVDTGTAIAVQVTGNDRVIWEGTNTTAWTTAATGNWKLQSSPATPTDFIESDDVIFPDAPVNSAVALAANVSPSKVTFNNTVATSYAITGAGGIIGATGLTKTANGTVTLSNPNAYSGTTAVQAGTLVLDHATATPIGALSTINVSPAAMVKFTHTGGVFSLVNTLTGTGTVVIDPGAVNAGNRDIATVTWDATGFSGTLNLKPTAGTMRLQVDALADLGTGPVVVDDRGQAFFNTTNALTVPNNFTLTGTGFSESAGTLGAIRASNGSVFTGTTTISGAAKIGALGNTTTFSNTLTGGTLTFGGSINSTSSETLLLTGSASGLAGLVVNDGSATSSGATITFNVGNGGTTGTLGAAPVSLKADGFKNAVVRFDRADGYTLGGAISSSATAVANEVRNFVDLDSTGTGFNDGGIAITLGSAAPASGGNIRVGQSRANAVATLTGTSISETIAVSSALSGATLNVNGGANVTTNFLQIGNAANATGGVLNQNGGAVNVVGQVRVGHFATETGTYNMNGGVLTLTGASPTLTPSTAGAGAANSTGDNNINGGATASIHGGGIYLGIDGTGIFNHNGGTVTTNWIVLDNRGDTAAGNNMDGVDKYSLSGAASILNLRSTYGLIQRNTSSLVTFGGGTVRVDNTGTGTGTGANITIPLDATIDTVASTTTNLDTNGAGNGFTLPRDVRGSGTLNLIGGGTVNVSTAGNQIIAAKLSGTGSLTKLGTGTTSLTGSGAGYTGAVTITSGQLNVPNDLAATSITLADATLLGGEPSVGTVTIGTAVRADVVFNPNTAGALTAGTLAVNAATSALSFSESPTGPGPWTAINYTTKTGPGSFGLLASGAYRAAAVVTDTGSSITVNVTGLKNETWTGAVGAIWDSGATANTNWNDGVGADNFFAGDTVTFPEGGANPSVTVTSGVSPWKTSVTSATTAYTLNSTLGGITGPGNLEKSGGSTLTLVGPNTYFGKTVVGGGTVSIAAATSLGSAGINNTIAINGGGRLSLTVAMDLGTTRAIAIGAGGGSISLNNAAAQTVTVSGNLSGSDALSFHSAAAGGGTFVLSGSNSGYTGAISVDAQSTGLTTLRIATQAAAPASGSITLNYPAAGATGNASTLDLPGIALPAGVTLNTTSFLNGAISLRSQVTSSGIASINGPITVAGTAIVQLSSGSGTLSVNGNVTAGGGGFNASTSVFFLRGAGNGVVNGTITLPGASVSKTDAANWTINSTGNDWAFTGVLSSGSVRLGNNNALPIGAILSIGQASDANASLLEMNGFNQQVNGLTWIAGNANSARAVGNSNAATQSTLTLNSSTDYTYGASTGITGGNITGNIALVKNGTNTQTLAGPANTYTGNVTVNNGTLVAGGIVSSTALGNPAIAGRAVTVNSPGLLSFTTNNVYGNGVGNNNLPATIVNGTTLSSTRYNVLGNLTLNGATLTQAATDAGSYEGYQFRGNVGVAGTAASTILTTNGKANHLAANTLFTVANVTGDTNTDLLVSAPLRNQSGDFALAAGALTKSGAGTMELTAVNVFTGGVTINDGTLKVNADAALGASAGAVAINNNAALQASGTVTTAARTVTLGVGGGTIDTNGQRVNLNAGSTVTGTTLTKTGAGVLTLAGTQTYAALDVDAGDVNLDSPLGTGASNVNVDGRMNISVSQTFGDLTIGSGGIVSVGGVAFAPPAPDDGGGLAFDGGGDLAAAPVQGVPEPGSAMLLLGGMLTLLGLRRR